MTLLDELANLDVVLSVANGRLIVDAPDDVLTPQLLESIRQNKPALLSLLAPAVDPSPVFELSDERFRGWELLPDADGNRGWEPPAGTSDCIRWWATDSGLTWLHGRVPSTRSKRP